MLSIFCCPDGHRLGLGRNGSFRHIRRRHGRRETLKGGVECIILSSSPSRLLSTHHEHHISTHNGSTLDCYPHSVFRTGEPYSCSPDMQLTFSVPIPNPPPYPSTTVPPIPPLRHECDRTSPTLQSPSPIRWSQWRWWRWRGRE